MCEAHRAVSGTVEIVAAILENVTQKEGGEPRREKGLADSKCVANLKVLGSDKSEFRMWNEKLINALAQAKGTEWRTFMRSLNRKLDVDRRILSNPEIQELDGADAMGSMEKAEENLYFVLVEKTEGDAALRVHSGEPGEGFSAYMRIYLWFAGTTGLALTEKTRMLMHPNPVKHVSEVAEALEKWAEQERTLRAHGEDYKLPAAFKVTALRLLMNCKREQFDTMEREAKANNGEKVCEGMFEDLFARIKEYAVQKRLDEIAKKESHKLEPDQVNWNEELNKVGK